MNLTIENLKELYRCGEKTPEQLIKDIMQRCEQYESHNIWITRLTESQLDPYLHNLKSYSPDDLPLYGIPFAIKDNIDLANIPTTAACSDFEYIPEKTAFVVDQLIEAGAIPIGKTNMDQFATGLVGTRSPEPWGPCKNAFNPEYISGGSSSGSAVSVALGLVSFSLGTDTAGSGRVPAAFNNLVGLKPSKGLLSMTGVVPACRSLDCVSIFALTTDDANAVLNQAAIYDDQDCYARPIPFDNNIRHYGLPGNSFKFAVPKPEQLEFFGNTSAQRLFEKSVAELEALGGTKQIMDFSPFLQAARLLYEGPWVAERYVAIEEIMTQRPDVLLPVIKTIVGSAEGKTAANAFKAEYEMQEYRNQAQQLLSSVDFLITPTTGTIYTIEEEQADPIKLNSNLGYYTNYMNLLDCASVAMPAGFLDNKLPWGITFVSAAMTDRLLLSYANLWQQKLKQQVGNVALETPITKAEIINPKHKTHLPIVVCGAHLRGLPLNWQLIERGAFFIEASKTNDKYELYALPGGPPKRPALVRSESGAEIEVEIWNMPVENYGSFVAGIPQPLGIGKIELIDGQTLPGFICEQNGIEGAENVTKYGSWRKYLSDNS